jgi:dolichol-phosphate mannosyltransferase
MSKSAALLAKPLLKSNVSDPMSGFFMTKKEVFKIIQNDLSGKGYKIFLEMIFCYEKKKGKSNIGEVPYHFRTRKLGESKLGAKVIFDYLQMLLNFALKKYAFLIKFLIVGLIGLFVNTTLLWFFTEIINLYYVFSGIIATELAIINNFLLNNFWTWNKRNKRHSFIKRFFSYNLVSLIGLMITIFTL